MRGAPAAQIEGFASLLAQAVCVQVAAQQRHCAAAHRLQPVHDRKQRCLEVTVKFSEKDKHVHADVKAESIVAWSHAARQQKLGNKLFKFICVSHAST